MMKDAFEIPRRQMVEKLRSQYKIGDERVLTQMQNVPRHLFVPEALRSQAYKDNALPISDKQTISQPFIVAKMTELLGLKGTEKILEIGCGSGYQTAILCGLANKVFAVERIESLASSAKERLRLLGYRNVSVKCTDGTEGWDVYSPYDAILVAAGGPSVPEPLLKQVKIGGKIVIPIGNDTRSQVLVRLSRNERSFTREDFGDCSFVPLIGNHGWER